MPNLEWNKKVWEQQYDWSAEGEEWSAAWGGSEAQWFGTLLPRIHRFVPASHILEIAPGFGRWSRFLKDFSRKLTLVDLSEQCINACKDRFKSDSHIDYFVNNGTSIDCVPDHSVDFLFSFDSLVHVEMEVLLAYIEGAAAKLRPDGVAFIHHSNLMGKYVDGFVHERARSVNAGLVASAAAECGLVCRSQEEISWGDDRNQLIDCISVITPLGSKWATKSVRQSNPNFMLEASFARSVNDIY